MDSLNGIDSGRFRVRTLTASYVIDFDSALVVRERAEEDAEALREDSEPITLLAVAGCAVGQRMILVLDLHLPNADFTTRYPTTIVSIDAIESEPVRPLHPTSPEAEETVKTLFALSRAIHPVDLTAVWPIGRTAILLRGTVERDAQLVALLEERGYQPVGADRFERNGSVVVFQKRVCVVSEPTLYSWAGETAWLSTA